MSKTPVCQYCNASPYKTYCKSFFDHVELCRVAHTKQPVVQPIVNVFYSDNRHTNIQVNITQTIETARSFMHQLAYEEVDDVEKVNTSLNKALEYIPPLSIAFDEPSNPLHAQSKQYAKEMLEIIKQKAVTNQNKVLIEELDYNIQELSEPDIVN